MTLRINLKTLVKTPIRELIKQKRKRNRVTCIDMFLCPSWKVHMLFSEHPISLFDVIVTEDGKFLNEQWYQQVFGKKTAKILLDIMEKRLDFLDMLAKHYVDNTPFIQEWEMHSRVIERHKVLSDAYKVLIGKLPNYAYAFYPYTDYKIDQFKHLNEIINQYFEFMQTYPDNDLAKLIRVMGW